MSALRVEILWWEGCPSTDRALAEVQEVIDDLGLEGLEVGLREVNSDEEAAAVGFVGSPTILVDGIDVSPPPEGEPASLSCRVYRRRDGRISPTPEPEDIRAALRRAAESQEVPR